MTHAMDRAQSARKYDLNGWFEVPNNPISKEGIFPYSGAQVGAPDADRIYRVYRPAEELGHEEALASFKLLPIIDDHTMLGEGFKPAGEANVSGVIGENVRFERGTLLANLKIYDGALAQKIKSGKTELSCGYRCVYDFTPGFWDGQPYDAVQRQIRGNHLALVDEGRMGPDVRVMDHMVFTADAKEILPVDEELKKVLDAMAATVKDMGERLAKLETPAADEDEPPMEEPAKDEDVPADPPAGDADKPTEEVKAMDALTKTVKALAAKVDALAAKPVMDEAAVVATLADKTDLATRLQQHVGVFDHSKMTHAQVAAYGVEKLALKVKPGGEAIALDAALQVKAKPTAAAAMDAANQASPLRVSIAKHYEGK